MFRTFKSLISLITALAISSAITDVTSGSVRCLSAFSVLLKCAAFFLCRMDRQRWLCRVFQVSMVQMQDSRKRSSSRCSIPYRCEDMRDDEGGRQRGMFLGKFEEPTLRVFVSQSHIFARHDSTCFVFIAILVHTCQARPHCRSVILRAVGFSRMQRFLMLSVFVETSVSHAVVLPDALAGSER